MNNQELLKTITAKAESYKEELFTLIQRMIQIRSYSGEEGELVSFLLQTMQNYGFDQVWSDQLGNAIGKIGNGPLTLLMDAHIDTVQVTESEEWPFPPFAGHIEDGVLYGRGVVDEKPAMAGYLMAGRILKEIIPDNWPFTLYIVGSVMEEECDGYPLRHIIEQEGIRPDFVLLGEPTDLQVYRGQRGRMEIEISVTGKSAHGAHNQQGDNAIYKMARLVQALEELDKQLPAVEPLGKGSLTVSDISSKAPSLCSVPDYSRIHIDRRLTLGENRESVLKQLQDQAQKLGLHAHIELPLYRGKSWKGTIFEQEAYFPTWVMEEEHPIVKAGMETAAAVLGQARMGVWSFSTNGVATAGIHHIPTIGFAPGKEELSHSAAEQLKLEDLHKATIFYTLFPFMLST